jgi:hypothetical protein
LDVDDVTIKEEGRLDNLALSNVLLGLRLTIDSNRFDASTAECREMFLGLTPMRCQQYKGHPRQGI